MVSSRFGFTLLTLVASSRAWGQSGMPIEYRNVKPTVAYVGSKSCEGSGCHDEICRNYPQTPMGHSMAPANSPSELQKAPKPTTVFDPKVNWNLEVFRDGSDLYQSVYQIDKKGRTVFQAAHRLAYVVGAGSTGFTYIFRVGTWLFEAPLSYYSETRQWDLSPGYAADDVGFTRPVTTNCLACHNGQPQAVPRRDGMYGDPPFRFGEVAIGCECCHGPGQLHVQEMAKKHAAGSHAPDTSIVNPARLPPRLADDICMNCHQGGDARVLQPGRNFLDFRPGTPLYQTLAIFKRPLREEQRAEADRLETLPPVRGSLETPLWWKNSSLQLSQCYQASQGRLTCIRCHVIHHRPTSAERAVYYRQRCLTCHNEASCRLPAEERVRQQPANDCVGCHMERRAVAGIPHSSDTKHRIVRRLGQPLPEIAFEQPTPDLPGLLCLNRPSEPAGESLPLITKLVAYWTVIPKDPSLKKPCLEVLDELSKTAAEDPTALACLGAKALFDEKDNARAANYFTRALKLGAEDPSTFLDLGTALWRLGRAGQADKVLERGVAAYPYVPALRARLALQYLSEHQNQRARELIKDYTAVFPENPSMRDMLNKVEGLEH